MLVACTVNVNEPPVKSSPAATLTGVVPLVPLDVFVYETYNVAGSESVAATTSITLKAIALADVKFTPTKSFIVAGKAFVVVFNLINS